MKKLFILLLAAMAFVACNDEEEFIDYSTWTVEELLATGGGIDYLVSQTKEINYDELNERLKTEVLSYCMNPVFVLQDGVWVETLMIGSGAGCMVLMEDNTFRHCFELEHAPKWGKLYRTHDAGDNAIVEMVRAMCADKIVAYAGDTLVIEYEITDYKIPTRFLAHFYDGREWVLNTYTNNWDDPASWMPR
ncbi:MAG: hypothetical protein E7145_04800 [Rikenellaceae bacterium]|nr:hypothetical protein [Rikenellaceae bacterium]